MPGVRPCVCLSGVFALLVAHGVERVLAVGLVAVGEWCEHPIPIGCRFDVFEGPLQELVGCDPVARIDALGF